MPEPTTVDPSVRAAAVTKLRNRLAAAPAGGAITVSVNMLGHVLAEHDDAKKHLNEEINARRADREEHRTELERLRHGAEAAMRDAGAQAATGRCEDCFCCIASGCHTRPDSTCPTNSLGDSVCPCTGD